MLLLQIPPSPPGVDPLAGWIIATLLAGLSTIFFLWQRQTAAESKRKDEQIDKKDALIARMLEAEHKNADANKRSISLLAEERDR